MNYSDYISTLRKQCQNRIFMNSDNEKRKTVYRELLQSANSHLRFFAGNLCDEITNEIDSYSKLESLSVKVCTSTNGKQENRTNISDVNANNGEVKTEQHPNYLKKPQQKNRWKNGKR